MEVAPLLLWHPLRNKARKPQQQQAPLSRPLTFIFHFFHKPRGKVWTTEFEESTSRAYEGHYNLTPPLQAQLWSRYRFRGLEELFERELAAQRRRRWGPLGVVWDIVSYFSGHWTPRYQKPFWNRGERGGLYTWLREKSLICVSKLWNAIFRKMNFNNSKKISWIFRWRWLIDSKIKVFFSFT